MHKKEEGMMEKQHTNVQDNQNYCDSESGICNPSSLGSYHDSEHNQPQPQLDIIYVGDPMCSWCWGISNELKKLRDTYKSKGVDFQLIVGGLRPGGGDPWNDQMKDLLRHHWEAVQNKSGQPFSYDLLELDEFNYDTEPSCRAIVAARPFLEKNELEFFEAIQYKFYVEGEDPTQSAFYESICNAFKIDFNQFLYRFNSNLVKEETFREFQLNRAWGVQGYPTVIVRKDGQMYLLTNGFADYDVMQKKLETLLYDR